MSVCASSLAIFFLAASKHRRPVDYCTCAPQSFLARGETALGPNGTATCARHPAVARVGSPGSAVRWVMFNVQGKSKNRRGTIAVLTVACLIMLLAMVGFAVDMGYIVLVRTQLQVAADSAAIAAAWARLDSPLPQVLATAQDYASRHVAGGKTVNLGPRDVEFGWWDSRVRRFNPGAEPINALRVVARRDLSTNGRISLFFAPVLGLCELDVKAQAVAAFADNFSGFRLPNADATLPVLPIAIDKKAWDALLAGSGTDQWSWDDHAQRPRCGSDGVLELSLFPARVGAPGNWGTLRIGRNNNSTRELSRQIREGLNQQDLEPYGGRFELGKDSTLVVGGDPGLSNAIRDDLESIIGQPRVASLYAKVAGQGSNAQYTLVGFAGVRILDVKLTGPQDKRRVVAQPATVVIPAGTINRSAARTSYGVYSTPCIVQ